MNFLASLFGGQPTDDPGGLSPMELERLRYEAAMQGDDAMRGRVDEIAARRPQPAEADADLESQMLGRGAPSGGDEPGGVSRLLQIRQMLLDALGGRK